LLRFGLNGDGRLDDEQGLYSSYTRTLAFALVPIDELPWGRGRNAQYTRA